MTHLDQFAPAERDALAVLERLHDALREATGTNRRFRAGSAEEMQCYCATVARAMVTVGGNPDLLAEFGRQRTTALSVTGPQCLPGGVPEADLHAFYHAPKNLRAAGLLAIKEIAVNVRQWRDECDDMLTARGAPLQ
ncbi:hypothetical protein AWB67_00969 [Caballeronia terrestris]|uniref:Uncharacterized protein n=1 Tax=Caballeronia terrestris TaxID=1226301 RepID=A0A158FYL5_9BURK|nr:hypothetical protein [Caballeronia terrestris]SAL24905.1 hypothetical protein AWB67_00969 [Caballeronia terrestris]